MHALKPFDYFEPGTVQEALEILSIHDKKAKVLAGGIDLIPRMRKGKINADYVVNIQKIPGLEYFESGKEGLKFGAMNKLCSIENSEVIQKNYPILYEAIHQIASTQTKYMGTVVGNLCVGTPASDIATALFALGAELKIAGINGERTEPIENFYPDYGCTSLNLGEMVTGVLLPVPQAGTKTAFLNIVRTRADIAKISVAIALATEEGVCKEAKIVIGAAAPTVIRAKKAEALLKDGPFDVKTIQRASATAAEETKPITDLRSTAEYRKEMARVLVTRALEQALEPKNANERKMK
ncbi:xanthine dehydrogenase family protein subunit M [bacterium]|nr:xanthine dehydrogenase family protein subunit M [bacterium]